MNLFARKVLIQFPFHIPPPSHYLRRYPHRRRYEEINSPNGLARIQQYPIEISASPLQRAYVVCRKRKPSQSHIVCNTQADVDIASQCCRLGTKARCRHHPRATVVVLTNSIIMLTNSIELLTNSIVALTNSIIVLTHSVIELTFGIAGWAQKPAAAAQSRSPRPRLSTSYSCSAD